VPFLPTLSFVPLLPDTSK